MNQPDPFLRTEGFLVRWGSLGGGDRWFSVLTAHHGFIRMMAAARKMRETPTLAHPVRLDRHDLLLLPRRRSSGMTLVEARLTDRPMDLATRCESMGGALFVAELAEQLSAQEDPQPAVFQLLEEVLRELRSCQGPSWCLTLAAALKLFSSLGYALDFEACRACGKSPSGEALFRVAGGGFVHQGCGGERSGLPVSPGTLRFLARLTRHSVGEARRVTGDRRVMRESFALLTAYVNFLCQKRLPTQGFLEKLAPAGPVSR